MISSNPDWNRRSFMAAMLGACAAPAIVRAESLMPIWTPAEQILLPDKEIEIYSAEWLDVLKGERSSGASTREINEGKAVALKGRDGATFMGYNFSVREI